MKETIIYIRTSTEEQNPDNQLKDCEELAKKLNLNCEAIPEQQSAFKDNEREKFEAIRKAIINKQIKNLICWDLDRLYRNRKNLIAFFELCKINNCKIYSYRQAWLEDLNKIPSPFDEIMTNLMLQVMGWLAEDESKKKSERVKIAVRKEKGITTSYKGNKWGRKSLSENTIKEILDLRKRGKSITEISKQVFYWNKNNNKRFVSRGIVHKTITENISEQSSFKPNSKIEQLKDNGR